ncbi:hypothetical protein ACIGZJ_31045 [Kitasatospora sp. NPDC052868]|uniref:hypothetical protein n=1 Tax=Kitasatospora sp. NPDC052868 TaxID=3364060 RepID=UPI0037C5FECC
MTNLGLVPETDPGVTTATAIDRHLEMAGLLADPATVLMNALAEWATVVTLQEPDDTEVVAMVQVMDLRHGGDVIEGLTHRTTLLLAQLLRRDADLRAEHGIPTAASWAGGTR